ncbi:DUF4148 domain-containing protein [Paraburkholderia diazotrophica]|uniref:DUF4148 domain-containing protein n=1 Tax=Paraburkholderia diazotrophica TaxID=667676 RepID=UPI003179D14E
MDVNRVYQALFIAAALALPLASHAQSQSPATRAQVRAELVAAGHSGQLPQSDTRYPEPASYPGAALHAFHRSHALIAASYGPSTNGSFASGFRATRVRSLSAPPSAYDDVYRGQ